jgi:hypothetical protein
MGFKESDVYIKSEIYKDTFQIHLCCRCGKITLKNGWITNKFNLCPPCLSSFYQYIFTKYYKHVKNFFDLDFDFVFEEFMNEN